MFRRIMSDRRVERYYRQAGEDFGDAVSYLYMGCCVGFDSLLRRWERWEQEYSNRGYRTVSLDDFLASGGYGTDISALFGVKRDVGEVPVLYAQRYRCESGAKGRLVDTLDVVVDRTGN